MLKRELCDPVRKMSYHMKRDLSGKGIGHEKLENSGSDLTDLTRR